MKDNFEAFYGLTGRIFTNTAFDTLFAASVKNANPDHPGGL
jgi:hypothetical protein